MAKSSKALPLSKNTLFARLAAAAGLSKKQVSAVFDALTQEILKALKKDGPGTFILPGLCKIVRKQRPGKPAHMGRMAATGQPILFKGQRAKYSVRIRPLKKLHEVVAHDPRDPIPPRPPRPVPQPSPKPPGK